MKPYYCEISEQQEGREDLKASVIFFFLTKDQESKWHWTTQEKLWKLEVKIMKEKDFQHLELCTQMIKMVYVID